MVDKIYRVGDPAAPAGAKFIRPEQEKTIQAALVEPTKSILWGSEMDTGKSLCAAEVVIRGGFERVLFVGEKDTFHDIAARFLAQSDGAIVLRRIDTTKAGKQNLDALIAGEPGVFFAGSQILTTRDWKHVHQFDADGHKIWKIKKSTGEIIVTPSMQIGPRLVPSQLSERVHLGVYKKMKPLDMFVFDEVHVIANRKSIGRRTVVSIPTEWKLGMSGTWTGNFFSNAWSITRWLWPDHIDSSSVRWAAEWCVQQVQLGKNGQPVLDVRGKPVVKLTGEKTPGLFVTTLPHYVRLLNGDDVPEPELFKVDLLPEQRADYDALVEDGLVWLKQHGNLEPLVTNLPPVKRIRMRQGTLGVISFNENGGIGFAPDCKSSKLWALRQIVDRPDWTGRAVGIFVDSKKFAKVVVARMNAAGYPAVEWSGDVPSKKRDEIKRRFLAGDIRYLVSVIRSFNKGLDGFQAVCNRVIWLDEDDNNTANEQAIKRYFRSGNAEMMANFKHVKIVAIDTLDMGILRKNEAGTSATRTTLKAA